MILKQQLQHNAAVVLLTGITVLAIWKKPPSCDELSLHSESGSINKEYIKKVWKDSAVKKRIFF
ncbi:hypothetical protein CU633_06850 [Bacillus sp. V3-13]|nr:hypothetical protein CU633_06850 [Bacillus sp. V3-13]